mgnify:CR=1 FL=1
MVKNRERVRFCFVVFCFIAAPDAAKTGLGRAAIHCCRTRHAARRVEGYNFRTHHAARCDAAFRQDTAFKQDYYALKSHYVSACPANPQSRHLQDYCLRDYYAVKSHFVPLAFC